VVNVRSKLQERNLRENLQQKKQQEEERVKTLPLHEEEKDQ
jgi:hypothetical protein